MRAKSSPGPVLWPLALALIGIVLLLDNFLLLGDFNPVLLWPLLLVIAGAHILLNGDLLPGWHARTFGITRGSVESATLEISAGEIDVQVRHLQREGRLIAGQYAAQSRPQMSIDETHAALRMSRAQTPWFSLADWDIGLARDLPWNIFVSTHLGQVNLDLSQVFVQSVIVGTGFGDMRVVCPREAFGLIRLHSTLGNIQVITPHGTHAQITVRAGQFMGLHVDSNHYEEIEPGCFRSRDADPDAPVVQVQVRGTFGDVYLA